MNTDKEIIEAVEAFVPDAPESYARMIDETAAELNNRSSLRAKKERKAWKPFAAAAAVVAALMLSAAVTFAARPALAAEIPGVNGIVYAASAARSASEADAQRIEALLNEALYSLAVCDYEAAARCFREGGMSDQANYFAAAYLNYLLTAGESAVQNADAGELEINDLQAEKKAFRYTAHVTIALVSKDGAQSSEECTASILENSEGMLIERIKFESEDYKAYTALYRTTFGSVPPRYEDVELIPIDNSILRYADGSSESEGPRLVTDRWNRLIMQLDYISASDEEKDARSVIILRELYNAEKGITPAVLSAEELAAELMYRYWLGGMTGEVGDFSDIMERNEDTDLFFWDARLEADRITLGLLKPLASVEKKEAMILETLEETETCIKARFYVYTDITDGVSQGVGEEIILTLAKRGGEYRITGFDRGADDGLYNYSLKPLAEKYKAAGISWQDAGRMAYDAVHERLEADAGWTAGD